jgi:hypothetical protein
VLELSADKRMQYLAALHARDEVRRPRHRVERDVNASVRSRSICWSDAGRACLSGRGLIKMAALCGTNEGLSVAALSVFWLPQVELDDPVATPRFIETLPRRGYRFTAPVDAGSSTSSPDGPVNAPYALLARYYDVLCGYSAPVTATLGDGSCAPFFRRCTALAMSAAAAAKPRSNWPDAVWKFTPSTARPCSARPFAPAHGGRGSASGSTAMTCATSLPRPVDLVLAEFASVNNLADRRDLSRVFDSVARALRDGGWFCFDVNTPLSLRTQYPQTFWEEHERFKLGQHGSLEADGRRARLDFEWLVPSGRLLRHVRETRWHVCWTDAEIRRALQVAGFDLVQSFDGLDVRPRTAGEKPGTDAYYLARKRNAARSTGHPA